MLDLSAYRIEDLSRPKQTNMVIRSKPSVPIPTVSVPDFVFNSPDAPPPESPLLISAENPERFLCLSSYRDHSRRFAAGLKASARIERVLLSHPDVLETVVYEASPIHDGSFDGSFEGKQASGETFGSQRLRAYIVKAKGSNLTAQDVDSFLAQQAPAMKSLSGGVVFLDSIPKTTVSLKLLLRHEVYL